MYINTHIYRFIYISSNDPSTISSFSVGKKRFVPKFSTSATSMGSFVCHHRFLLRIQQRWQRLVVMFPTKRRSWNASDSRWRCGRPAAASPRCVPNAKRCDFYPQQKIHQTPQGWVGKARTLEDWCEKMLTNGVRPKRWTARLDGWKKLHWVWQCQGCGLGHVTEMMVKEY